MNGPNKVAQVRTLFEVGQTVECVENTFRPELNGTTRKLVKVGKSFADCADGFYMSFPTRVRDVVSVDDDSCTYLLDQTQERLKGHTVTLRVLEADHG